MKRLVFASFHLAPCELVRQALALEGIPSDLANDRIGFLAGEVPFAECMVEVWVGEADFGRACAVLARAAEGSAPATTRPCVCCGEPVGSSLALCWSCGALQEGVDAPEPGELPSLARPTRAPARRWRHVLTAVGLVLAVSFTLWLVEVAVAPDPAFLP